MNIDTGRIRTLAAGETPNRNEVSVNTRDATKKQLTDMRVAVGDNTSPLGRQRTQAVRTRNQQKRDRKNQ